MKNRLKKYFEPLLHVPLLDRYHWWFALILDPRYLNGLAEVRALHEIESVETRAIFLEIMPKFYNYIVAAEWAENPYSLPPTVTATNWALYSIIENLGHTRTSSRGGINIHRYSIESKLNFFCNAAPATTAIKNEDVLTWYKESQIQFQMLSCLATTMFKLIPPKINIRKTSTLQGYVLC